MLQFAQLVLFQCAHQQLSGHQKKQADEMLHRRKELGEKNHLFLIPHTDTLTRSSKLIRAISNQAK